MRHYRNTVTGAEIFTESELHGGDWVEIIHVTPKAEPPQEPTKAPTKEPAKKTGKRAKK